MSALPSAEEIKLKIKVEKGLTDKELQAKFNEVASSYPAYKKSSPLIWFLVAKDLNVPVVVRKSDASRPAVEVLPKEDFIRLVDFDTKKHFVFNARGYVVDKWSVDAPKMRGGILLADETQIEKVAVFAEHEQWLTSVEIGNAYHFQSLGFMEENEDKHGKKWPRTLRTGFRTEIEPIEEGEYELPNLSKLGNSLDKIPDSIGTTVARGVIISAEMRNRYVGCTTPNCYKGTGAEEGEKVRCEKCGRLVEGKTLKGLNIILQDHTNEPLTVRFGPWFNTTFNNLDGRDVLVVGEFSEQYRVLDGAQIIHVDRTSDAPKEIAPKTFAFGDLDFSIDNDAEEFEEGERGHQKNRHI